MIKLKSVTLRNGNAYAQMTHQNFADNKCKSDIITVANCLDNSVVLTDNVSVHLLPDQIHHLTAEALG